MLDPVNVKDAESPPNSPIFSEPPMAAESVVCGHHPFQVMLELALSVVVVPPADGVGVEVAGTVVAVDVGTVVAVAGGDVGTEVAVAGGDVGLDHLRAVDGDSVVTDFDAQFLAVDRFGLHGLNVGGHDFARNDVVSENRDELGFVLGLEQVFNGALREFCERLVGRRENGDRSADECLQRGQCDCRTVRLANRSYQPRSGSR